jgi:type VI secretion system protein ImpK
MPDPPKSPTLAELASEIFLLVPSFRERADLVDFDTLSQGVLALFEEFDRNAKALKIDPEDIAAAKYALAAFLDEAILRSQWPGKERWADNPLQLQLFETYLAGEGFFEKLDALRGRGEAAAEVIEIYHLCLALGFEGKYGIEGTERLQALARVIQDELRRFRPVDLKNVSPHWKIVESPRHAADKLPRWLIYACAAVVAVCILLYIAFFIDIRSSSAALENSQKAAILLQTEKVGGSAIC